MLKTENVDDNFIHHYSDSNFLIKQIETGGLFQDAVDVVPCKYTYEETDIPIEIEESEETE